MNMSEIEEWVDGLQERIDDERKNNRLSIILFCIICLLMILFVNVYVWCGL